MEMISEVYLGNLLAMVIAHLLSLTVQNYFNKDIKNMVPDKSTDQ